MKKLGFGVSLLFLCGLAAQTVQTIPYRAVLSNNNEVPATSIAASGAATILLHVVRDATGKVVSGSADANVSYKFPAAVSITAMHIHAAPAGTNGGIVLPFGISRTDDATGAGSLPAIQTQFPITAVTLDTINGILADPSQFYFNVHTTDAPGGAMRGQLQRAEMTVRMGIMKPENETPAITGQPWSGIGTVTSLITRDSAGNPTSALVIFDLTYSGFPDDTTFTGFHIHLGPAAVAGPVTINTGLRSLPVVQGGSGSLHYEVEADVSQQAVVNTLNAISFDPSAAYINVHTAVAPGGAARSQLLWTDRTDFQVTMSPANEVPALTALTATNPTAVNVFTVRNTDGTAAAGTVIFDSNPRFPAGTTITAMHIHDGVAGVNGPVTIDSGLASSPLLVADGTGNVFRIAQVKNTTALATLNSLVVNPEKHYVNMHTTANPGGATRAQLVAANTALPQVTFVETAVQDPRVTTLAPGGLALIAGSNLTKVAGDLSGFNGAAGYPLTLNGVQVTVGGKQAPIESVAPDRIFAQVPFETAAGSQPVVVTTSNGASPAYNATVAANAPAIFIYSTGAVAFRMSDQSLITPSNPAHGGDTIAIFATGLGQTTPPLVTGQYTGNSIYLAGTVTLRLAGLPVPVIQSVAVPGFIGVYAVLATVPAGFASGNAPLVMSMGGANSNVSSLAIQ